MKLFKAYISSEYHEFNIYETRREAVEELEEWMDDTSNYDNELEANTTAGLEILDVPIVEIEKSRAECIELMYFYEKYEHKIKREPIYEWCFDEEYTMGYREDCMEEGYISDEEFYSWKKL